MLTWKRNANTGHYYTVDCNGNPNQQYYIVPLFAGKSALFQYDTNFALCKGTLHECKNNAEKREELNCK